MAADLAEDHLMHGTNGHLKNHVGLSIRCPFERHNLGWAVVTVLYRNCLLCRDHFVNLIMQTRKWYACMMTANWSHNSPDQEYVPVQAKAAKA